eukprot:Skav225764  [mRNA]  locus=scaffold3552:221942:223984:- [translate_table: standard]
MPSAFYAFVALVACVAAQCPDELVNRTRCNAVDTVVGPDAETCNFDPDFSIDKALQWAFQCELPVEVRVGLTMSLTGNRSDEGINRNILQVLANWSSEVSTKSAPISRDDVDIGHINMCIRFCVMDDESSEQKMVDLYRSFSGDGNSFSSASTPSRAVLLLGPGTEDFRNAAAQVANEYQKPMILWSLPKDWVLTGADRC